MAGVVRVAVPGDPQAEFVVRVPDLAALVLGDWLPVPLLHDAAAVPDDGRHPIWIRTDLLDETPVNRIDDWLALVCVQPRVVLGPEAPDDALLASDLDGALKRAIWAATYQPLRARMEAFAAQAAPYLDGPGWHVAALDTAARRYGRRPSELIGLDEPAEALDFDLAVAFIAAAQERRRLAGDGTTH